MANDVEKKSRTRSPNYPAVSLRNAIERVTKFYKADGRGGAKKDGALKQIGFTSAHGQAMTVLSALTKFGLIDEQCERIVPTRLAIDIIEFPEGNERHDKGIREAALKPSIYAELMSKFREARCLPSDESLKPELIADYGFNPKVVDGFLADFRDSLEFSGLLSGNELNLTGLAGETAQKTEIKVCDFVQWTSQGVGQFHEPRQVVGVTACGGFAFVEGTETGIPMDQLTITEKPIGDTPPRNPYYRPAIPTIEGNATTTFSLDEGDAYLTCPKELSPESFREFDAWLQVTLDRMARKAGVDRTGSKSANL